jgi:hypothetical protein
MAPSQTRSKRRSCRGTEMMEQGRDALRMPPHEPPHGEGARLPKIIMANRVPNRQPYMRFEGLEGVEERLPPRARANSSTA